jgi:hypothetical protein
MAARNSRNTAENEPVAEVLEFLPNGWRPKAGDELINVTVTDITMGEGDYQPYPIITVEDESGNKTAIHAFHGVLQREMVKRRPDVGTKFSLIKYLGKKESGGMGGEGYHVYVVKGAEDKPFSWDQVQSDADM